MEVVVNDSVTREAISRAEERKVPTVCEGRPHFAGIMKEFTYYLKQAFASRILWFDDF